MKSLQEIIKTKPKEKLSKSPRTQVIKEIYQMYDSLTEKKVRRDENIKRYRVLLQHNGLKHNKDMYIIFSRTKTFIRPITPSGMAYWLSPFKKMQDLFYIKSVCKDRNNRGESIGAYIIGLSRKFLSDNMKIQ